MDFLSDSDTDVSGAITDQSDGFNRLRRRSMFQNSLSPLTSLNHRSTFPMYMHEEFLSRMPIKSSEYPKSGHAVPIFDTRNSQMFTKAKFCTFENVDVDSEVVLKTAVCRKFDARPDSVHVVEKRMTKEGAKKRTHVVVFPIYSEKVCYLMLETQESLNHDSLELIYGRFEESMTVEEIKTAIVKETRFWKGVALCVNNRVLRDNDTIRMCGLKNLDHIQVLQLGSQSLRFCHQPRLDIENNYSLEVDLKSSVKDVKQQFQEKFHSEIQKFRSNENQQVVFSVQDSLLLDDDLCLGIAVQHLQKADAVSLQFSVDDVISVNVKFKRPLKERPKVLAVSRSCSSKELREAISCRIPDCRNWKTVKMLLSDKLIDECSNLEQEYGDEWKDGCTVYAGIKKCKRLRIKHPEWPDEELVMEMYSLEKVKVLKRAVSEKWEIPEIQFTLCCQEQEMHGSAILQRYPIKNNIEITMKLFKKRIAIEIFVVFKKQRLNVFINDSSVTTVDDLLRYCALELQYDSMSSSSIFQNRCLDKWNTLEQEKICSGSKIFLVKYELGSHMRDGLIDIFMAKEDGHIVKRIGSVQGGVLLHAPKRYRPIQSFEHRSVSNGPRPPGLEICDDERYAEITLIPVTKPSVWKDSEEDERKMKLTKEKQLKKAKFLKQARKLKTARLPRPDTVDCTSRKQLYSGEGNKTSSPIKHSLVPGHQEQLESENLNKSDNIPENQNGTGNQRPVFYCQSADNFQNNEFIPQSPTLEEAAVARPMRSIGETWEKQRDRDHPNTGTSQSRIQTTDVLSGGGSEYTNVHGELHAFERTEEVGGDDSVPESDPFDNRKGKFNSNTAYFKLLVSGENQNAEGNIAKKGRNMVQLRDELKTEFDFDVHDEKERNYKVGESRICDSTGNVDDTLNKSKDNANDGLDSSLKCSKLQASEKMSEQNPGELETYEEHQSDLEIHGKHYNEASQHSTLRAELVLEQTEADPEGTEQLLGAVANRQTCPFFDNDTYGHVIRRCPYLQFLHRHHRRQRDSSASQVELSSRTSNMQTALHPVATFPQMHPAQIEYGRIEITARFLQEISKGIVKKWKNVARSLDVDENEIDQIKSEYSSEGAQEMAYQALLHWMRSKGQGASVCMLCEALVKNGLQLVADIVTRGYHTA